MRFCFVLAMCQNAINAIYTYTYARKEHRVAYHEVGETRRAFVSPLHPKAAFVRHMQCRERGTNGLWSRAVYSQRRLVDAYLFVVKGFSSYSVRFWCDTSADQNSALCGCMICLFSFRLFSRSIHKRSLVQWHLFAPKLPNYRDCKLILSHLRLPC